MVSPSTAAAPPGPEPPKAKTTVDETKGVTKAARQDTEPRNNKAQVTRESRMTAWALVDSRLTG